MGSEGAAGSGLEVRLLGPFELALSGRAVEIGSAKQRAILALLALQAGKVVACDTLCHILWNFDQPASRTATLQSLISRLRRVLGSAPSSADGPGRDWLRTREPGWVLDVDGSAVDALRFEALTARARGRSARGEAEAARADLAEAVGLWRGSALVDVVSAGYLSTQATRLDEARLDAVEDLADAELATGRPGDALARLEAHVEANPIRERAWGQLMVALYRLGRPTTALRAFQQVRTILRDELGLEPSPALAEIEQGILRHDPALAGPSPQAPPVESPDAAPPAVARAAPTSPVLPRREGPEFADYSVVVVEDHDFQRRTVVQLLRGLGVGTVTDASNGAEALRLIEAGPAPDIIICDIDMPGMDGIELVGHLARRNLACAIVIASGLEANVLRAVETIGTGHGLHVLAALEKPLTARRLGEVLRHYTRLTEERADQRGAVEVTGEALRNALARGELKVRFQPRVDLTTGVLSGAAATGCWLDADRAPIPPSVFVPALVREGLVLPFVERLLGSSCSLLDHLERTGLDADVPFKIGVNLSPVPFVGAALADRLAEIVRTHTQDPRRIVCELDEMALARAPRMALEVLTRLRVKGFGLAIIHAGAGSPIADQLGRVPLTEVRLDRRLVSGAVADPKRLAKLESAVASARDAGLAVIADGCDSRADFDMLLELGCTEAQGGFVADPVDAADMVIGAAWCPPDWPGAST